MPTTPYAWLGDVSEFLSTPEEELLRRLTEFGRETGAPQIFAWDRSLRVLREQLQVCLPVAAPFALVLEFELPRCGGSRPDLVVLENGTILVIEFKNRVDAEPGDFEQVLGYVHALRDYHSASHQKTLIPVLIPIGFAGEAFERNGVHVIPPASLADLIRKLTCGGTHRPKAREWVAAQFQPQPVLVEAARLLFERQPLPRIKSAESARIPETIARIESIMRDALQRGERLLILLTGVPGSGKTLVGLQIAHSRALGESALFLSGNGPLVQVLRYALHSNREFVEDMHAYVREHLISRPSPPRERVLIFDEAQRAWDRDRVLDRHRGQLDGSEPELLLRIANAATGGFCMLALIGEGQEIHTGEEGGLPLWAEALAARPEWRVVGPPKRDDAFRSAGLRYDADPLLDLTVSLRSPRAARLAHWCGLLLNGRLDLARSVAEEIHDSGFMLLGSPSLGAVKSFVHNRYEGQTGKRYGLITSSKYRRAPEELGVQIARQPFYYYGPWFEDPPSSPRSCCSLDLAISEFGCQGLELDLPVVLWGPDLDWTGTEWAPQRLRKNPRIRDARRLRLNAYRVLLTRGRDGVLLHVPSNRSAAWDALTAAGVHPLR